MKFSCVKDAKYFALRSSSRTMNETEVAKTLKDYRNYLSNSVSDEDKGYWKRHILALEEWAKSDELKNGNYPEGLDQLMLEVVELRAIFYAFHKLKTDSNPFSSHLILSQWYKGSSYIIFCNIAKLLSNDKRDNSITKVWNSVSQFMLEEKSISLEEHDLIRVKLDKNFIRKNSASILFRNKNIAHNECLPKISWEEIDQDIMFLIRVWSLLVSWCSSGILYPFKDSNVAFSGLEHFFPLHEIALLRREYNEYIKKIKFIACKNPFTKEVDASPFAEIRCLSFNDYQVS